MDKSFRLYTGVLKAWEDASGDQYVSGTTSSTETCPACGSSRRHLFAIAGVATGEGVALSPGTHVREPRASYHNGRMQKSAQERRTGPSPSADDVVRFRSQAWNREADWYEEAVTNPDGSEHHHQGHPLSEHRGYGSARLKQAPDGD